MVQSIKRFHRRFSWPGWLAFGALLTVAVTWLWAHEGHAPLPTKGVDTSQLAEGKLTISSEARALLNVQTEKVDFRPFSEKVLAYADVVAPWQRHAYVTTRLPGKIVKLYARPGQAVSAGEPLADVTSLQLEDLQNELLNAQNDAKLSERIVRQQQALLKEGVTSDKDFREAHTKHQQHVNALAIGRFKWQSLGLPAKHLEELLSAGQSAALPSLSLLSPISGIVIHADLTVGKIVEPTEHLFEIVDVSKVSIKLGVLEKDLHRIEPGQTVEITLAAYPKEIFSTTVQSKGFYLDPQSQLGTAWAELTNLQGKAARVLPGMHGQAQIVVSSQENALSVPMTALGTDGAERFVLVQNALTAKGSEFQKRNIVAGLRSGGFIQVLRGEVYRGDEVVTVGSHELFPFFEQGVLRLSREGEKNIDLRVEPVQPQVVEDTIEINGMVEMPPNHRAFASSQLAGTIQKIRVDRGQVVRAGDILAEVASLELQKLQLDLLRAHLQIGLVEETLKLLRRVDQLLAQRQVWETESLYNEVKNRRDSLQRKLELVGLSPEQIHAVVIERRLVEAIPIRAPVDGVVVHFDKVLGQIVKAQEPVFEIHDLSHAWIQGFLSENDMAKVRFNQKARVRLVADPHFVGEAVVRRSGQVFGVDTRSLSVWVDLTPSQALARIASLWAQPQANPAARLETAVSIATELKTHSSTIMQHNMLARITLVVDRPSPTLALPLRAVVREGSRTYVFVRKPDGLFERRAVELGRADDRHVEITRGLQSGEMVAVQGAMPLATAYASLR
jgi:cobalt-zinc-cadmium efflux system membrane fusion protein